MHASASNVATDFVPGRRIHHALTASLEKRALEALARRAPRWVTSDGLTALGFAAQIGAGASYAWSRYDRFALLAVILCLTLNWLGDSLDGTLARVRQQQRPRYGFYVDHVVDVLGATALMGGLALSGFVHAQVAICLLVAFLLLSAESYLATYTLGRFEMSQGFFGPTEIRLLLIAGNCALLHSPYAMLFGHRFLLFDVGGVIAVLGMSAMVLLVAARHTVELYRQEPLR